MTRENGENEDVWSILSESGGGGGGVWEGGAQTGAGRTRMFPAMGEGVCVCVCVSGGLSRRNRNAEIKLTQKQVGKTFEDNPTETRAGRNKATGAQPTETKELPNWVKPHPRLLIDPGDTHLTYDTEGK